MTAPPLDAECLAARAALPPSPPLVPGTLPEFRAGLAANRPDDAEVLGDSGFTLDEWRVPAAAAGEPEVRLLAAGPPGPRSVPLLYYLHGGGLVAGDARQGLPEVVRLAAAVGAAVASVEYRLAPEARYPAAIDDAYAGLTGVLSRAGAFGVDPARVVVAGRSAGGGLAAALSLAARDRGGPVVRGQLLIYPMLDDRNDTASAHQLAGLPMWNRTANAVAWAAYLGSAVGRSDVSPYAAPARAADLAGLPPTYVDVGSCDTFRDEDVAFAMRMWAAGGEAELHVWPGGFHGFDGVAPVAALSRAAYAARLDWLRRLLS